MCIGCGVRKPRSYLVRVARGPDGLVVDRNGERQGRGAYVCRSGECVEVAIRGRRLQKLYGNNAGVDLERLKCELANIIK